MVRRERERRDKSCYFHGDGGIDGGETAPPPRSKQDDSDNLICSSCFFLFFIRLEGGEGKSSITKLMIQAERWEKV